MVCVSGARHFATALRLEGRLRLRRAWLRPLTTDAQPCGEQLTLKPLAEPLRTHTTRPTSHSHLTKRPAVARATAGKVLATGCTRLGQNTRRGLSSTSTKWITSTTWSTGRATWSIFSSICRSSHQPRHSRPDLALTAEIACARKAHKVEDDGGDDACFSAPQAVLRPTLVALRPPLGVWGA